MSTRVKNRKGSGDEKCTTCESWLRHWENGTGDKKSICGTSGCSGSPVLGGHVVKVGGSDSKSYITPICSECNSKTGEFDVLWSLYPASDTSKCRA